MEGKNSPLFSHAKDNWRTPKELFEEWHAKYRFTLDVAADETNHLCKEWLGPGGACEDALGVDWSRERCWCNPPYSMVSKFVEKAAYEAVTNSTLTVMLIPSRTDTKWFHKYVWDKEKMAFYPWVKGQFLKGRVKFLNESGEASNSAPFPSMILVFGDKKIC